MFWEQNNEKKKVEGPSNQFKNQGSWDPPRSNVKIEARNRRTTKSGKNKIGRE